MFRRVVLPIDGSPVALAAVDSAVRASTPGGEIIAMTAVPTYEDILARTAASSRDARAAAELAQHSLAQQRAEAVAYLVEAARAVEAGGGRVTARSVESGDAGPAIVRAARAQGCDVIVMATNGRAGWKRAILGSVADYVARNSGGVPVLLVRHQPD